MLFFYFFLAILSSIQSVQTSRLFQDLCTGRQRVSVCVYVQHASACQHGRVTIDQDIFLHHVPVSTYVAPLVKL